MSSIFVSVDTMPCSFCSPSLAPTSTILTVPLAGTFLAAISSSPFSSVPTAVVDVEAELAPGATLLKRQCVFARNPTAAWPCSCCLAMWLLLLLLLVMLLPMLLVLPVMLLLGTRGLRRKKEEKLERLEKPRA